MTEIVERVARAMADAVALNYDHNEAIFKLYARAAIEAMREPTPEMVRALMIYAQPAEAWRMAIRQALIRQALK